VGKNRRGALFFRADQYGYINGGGGRSGPDHDKGYGDQSFKRESEVPELADELADTLFVIGCIANQAGIDLTGAVRKNIQKKTDRDRHRHHNNPKLSKRPVA